MWSVDAWKKSLTSRYGFERKNAVDIFFSIYVYIYDICIYIYKLWSYIAYGGIFGDRTARVLSQQYPLLMLKCT